MTSITRVRLHVRPRTCPCVSHSILRLAWQYPRPSGKIARQILSSPTFRPSGAIKFLATQTVEHPVGLFTLLRPIREIPAQDTHARGSALQPVHHINHTERPGAQLLTLGPESRIQYIFDPQEEASFFPYRCGILKILYGVPIAGGHTPRERCHREDQTEFPKLRRVVLARLSPPVQILIDRHAICGKRCVLKES